MAETLGKELKIQHVQKYFPKRDSNKGTNSPKPKSKSPEPKPIIARKTSNRRDKRKHRRRRKGRK